MVQEVEGQLFKQKALSSNPTLTKKKKKGIKKKVWVLADDRRERLEV
jgi:hypothetical protein